jgi:hypothetical protein
MGKESPHARWSCRMRDSVVRSVGISPPFCRIDASASQAFNRSLVSPERGVPECGGRSESQVLLAGRLRRILNWGSQPAMS